MTPLAQWLHDRRVGCRWEYNSPVDIGMGKSYTPDHEPGHERDAAELVRALGDALPVGPQAFTDSPTTVGRFGPWQRVGRRAARGPTRVMSRSQRDPILRLLLCVLL